MLKLNKTNQNGRSMVEMLGVLAIIGVLSVGGISGYSKAMAKFKLTKAQDQITMLLMNIRTAYATSPSYDGLSSGVATTFNLAPSDMVTGSGVMNGAFGGVVEVGVCTNTICKGVTMPSTTYTSYFYITMKALGREACISLSSSDWGSDGMVGMLVGSSGIDAVDLPLSLTGATSADKYCGSTQKGTDITWIYY